MFERYTERARRVIFFARYEASNFGSVTIETEHLLLGLLRENPDMLNHFTHDASMNDNVRKQVEGRITMREKVRTSVDLPLSEECKRILAYAAEEAERQLHKHIGPEHLLPGMLREEKCVAAQTLHECGFRLNTIREELARNPIAAQTTITSTSPAPSFPFFANPVLPKLGVVPNAHTAKRIAEAVWIPLYGTSTIADQIPLQAELKYNVWIVTGSSKHDDALFAFILQADGRILSIGRGPTYP
jgi:ATP-dependent Clp protease ATP-binding subunit ClpA